MAAIVRVKRRLDQDPVNSLLLSCKRFKCDDESDKENVPDTDEIRSVFKFAGTLTSKETDVESHVREAIRREKLQKEYKRHTVNITEKSRITCLTKATNNRFKIVSAFRSLDTSSSSKKPTDQKCSDSHTLERKSCANAPSNIDEETHSKSDESISEKRSDDSLAEGFSDQSASTVYCLFDIEGELASQEPDAKAEPPPVETITCNGIPMVREPAQSAIKPNEDGYVYDIYYMNSPDFDFRHLENILAVEALREELVYEEQGRRDSENEYGEDEDSNDEDNWRNDYPDEEEEIFSDVINFCVEQDSDDMDSGDDYTEDFGVSRMIGRRLKICDEDEDDAAAGEVYRKNMMRDLYEDYGEETT